MSRKTWLLGHYTQVEDIFESLDIRPQISEQIQSKCKKFYRFDHKCIPKEPNFSSIKIDFASEGTIYDKFDGFNQYQFYPLCIVRSDELFWFADNKIANNFARSSASEGCLLFLSPYSPNESEINKFIVNTLARIKEPRIIIARFDTEDPGSLKGIIQRAMLMAVNRLPQLKYDDKEFAEFGAWCGGWIRWKIVTDLWLSAAWDLQKEVIVRRQLKDRNLAAKYNWKNLIVTTSLALGTEKIEPDLDFHTIYEAIYPGEKLAILLKDAAGCGDASIARRIGRFTAAIGLGCASFIHASPHSETPAPYGLIPYLRGADAALAQAPASKSIEYMENNPFIQKNGTSFKQAKTFRWKTFEPMLDLPKFAQPTTSIPQSVALDVPGISPQIFIEKMRSLLPIHAQCKSGKVSVYLQESDDYVENISTPDGGLQARIEISIATPDGTMVYEDFAQFALNRHLTQPERVFAFLEGWAIALPHMLAQFSGECFIDVKHIAGCDVLDELKNCNTKDGFSAALLKQTRFQRNLKRIITTFV